jgi:hypothetical protein
MLDLEMLSWGFWRPLYSVNTRWKKASAAVTAGMLCLPLLGFAAYAHNTRAIKYEAWGIGERK